MPHFPRTFGRERLIAWLAVGWGSTTFLAWCLAWSWGVPSFHNDAALTFVALSALAISVALRLCPSALNQPLVFQPDASAPLAVGEGYTAKHNAVSVDGDLIWLGASAGLLNTFGLLSLMAPSLLALLPAIALTAMAEAWLRGGASPLGATGDRKAVERAAEERVSDRDANSEQCVETSDWLRNSVESRSPEGVRALSGWVRFELAAGQKSTHVVIGFSPTFMAVPEIELDEEADEFGAEVTEATTGQGKATEENGTSDESTFVDSACEAHVEHATAAGMRVAIKRRHLALPYRGKLLWHAAPVLPPETPTELLGRLP